MDRKLEIKMERCGGKKPGEQKQNIPYDAFFSQITKELKKDLRELGWASDPSMAYQEELLELVKRKKKVSSKDRKDDSLNETDSEKMYSKLPKKMETTDFEETGDSYEEQSRPSTSHEKSNCSIVSQNRRCSQEITEISKPTNLSKRKNNTKGTDSPNIQVKISKNPKPIFESLSVFDTNSSLDYSKIIQERFPSKKNYLKPEKIYQTRFNERDEYRFDCAFSPSKEDYFKLKHDSHEEEEFKVIDRSSFYEVLPYNLSTRHQSSSDMIKMSERHLYQRNFHETSPPHGLRFSSIQDTMPHHFKGKSSILQRQRIPAREQIPFQHIVPKREPCVDQKIYPVDERPRIQYYDRNHVCHSRELACAPSVKEQLDCYDCQLASIQKMRCACIYPNDERPTSSKGSFSHQGCNCDRILPKSYKDVEREEQYSCECRGCGYAPPNRLPLNHLPYEAGASRTSYGYCTSPELCQQRRSNRREHPRQQYNRFDWVERHHDMNYIQGEDSLQPSHGHTHVKPPGSQCNTRRYSRLFGNHCSPY